jgi:hypothetical protein
MTTLIEDMRLFLQQMCGAIGMSGTAMNVVPVVVLGVVLNIAAIGLVESVRTDERPACQKTTLRGAAQTELKVMRTVVTSTLKTISKGQRRGCVARSWVSSFQREVADYVMGTTGIRIAPMLTNVRVRQKRFKEARAVALELSGGQRNRQEPRSI